MIGPPLVKIGVVKAGEAGLNVTEDDLIQAYRVSDVGAITLSGVRNTFATRELNDWLVALDVIR